MDIFGTIIGAIGSLIENTVNWFSQKNTNETNQQINQNNLDFQAAQTQAQWERDDNAHQREVADLKAAGLSPLANVAANNNTQALGAPSPIAMQAPQISANSLINAALEDKALNETERHNRVQEGQEYVELNLKSKEIENKVRELSLKNKEIENTFTYQCKYLNYLGDQLNEVAKHNRNEESLKKLSISSEEYFKSIQNQTHGKFNYKVYSNVDEYQAALEAWTVEFDSFIDSLGKTSTSASTGSSSSKNGSADIGAGAGVTNTPFSVNGSVGGSFGSSSSENKSYSENITQKQQAMIDKWYHSHPMPVFIYHEK